MEFPKTIRDVAATVCLASAFFGAGCTEQKPLTPEEAAVARENRFSEIQLYADGIWLMPADEYSLQRLKDFKTKHPELKVVSFGQGPDYKYGGFDSGYAKAPEMVILTEHVNK